MMNAPKTVSNPDSPTNLIIVMGVSGSGKSTLAKMLAEHYHYLFLDADDFHSDEARAQMAKGIPLTDEQRAPWIASLNQRLQENLTRNINTVLAFSGLKQKHRNELRRAGLRTIFLFLHSEQSTIQARLNNRTGHFMAPQLLGNQFSSLENPINEIDTYALDTALDINEVATLAQNIVDSNLLKSSQ